MSKSYEMLSMQSVHSGSGPKTCVELGVSCKGLKKGVPEMVCVIFERKRNGWRVIGHTEPIDNSTDPNWQMTFVVNYWFEERQKFKFEVYSMQDSNTLLAKLKSTLGQIVSAPQKHFVKSIEKGPGAGTEFSITAKVLTNNRDTVQLHWATRNIDNGDKLGESQVYFVLSRMNGHDSFKRVLKSSVISNTQDSSWKPISVPAWDLCHGNHDRPLKMEVFTWDNKYDTFIGSFVTSLKELAEAMTVGKSFECVDEKKLGFDHYKNSGELYLKNFFIESDPTYVEYVEQVPVFLNYIQWRTKLKFSVAIDFTASNGKPADSKSLHYYTAKVENPYTTAISAVGEIIEDYDSDAHFPAYGFGARIPPRGWLSHNFFLNLSSNDPVCVGVDGILQAYKDSLKQVTLYGPTNFTPVIKEVMKSASKCLDGHQYHILVIITDGVITDMNDTRDAIVAAAKLPMSIIILGVGKENFEEMRVLDGNEKVLTGTNGVQVERDIVKFVEMRKFVDKGGKWDKIVLAKEVLEELPQQLEDWMTKNGIEPKDS